MPRSGINQTYNLPPNTDNQVPNTPISSSMFNAAMDDIAQTFNTAQPIAYGGTGATNAAAALAALGGVPGDGAGGATLISTDAGAAAAPILDLYRDSASPAVNDILGRIQFNGEDSAGNKQEYGSIEAVIADPVSGSEDAALDFYATVAGARTLIASAGPNLSGRGTPTNNNAAAGFIGEYTEAQRNVGSAIALTTAVSADVTSVSLTAGDWDVSGVVLFVTAAGTSVRYNGSWVSATSATFPTQPDESTNALLLATQVPGSGTCNVVTGVKRFSLASTTTVYLSAQAVFTVSTMTAYGKIRARRVR